MSARGLVLCPEMKRIVALPFTKFFNYGENEISTNLPDEECEILQKVDGSLGIIFYWKGKWILTTKSCFDSEQAIEGQKILNKKWNLDSEKYGYHQYVDKNYTYLVEIVYPGNKNVIDYKNIRELFYLNSYNRISFEELYQPTHGLSFLSKLDYKKYNIKEFVKIAKNIPKTQEGFVVHYKSGLRVKIKGDEYLRANRMLEQVTPLNIWSSLKNCDDMSLIRSEIPEEHYEYFDSLVKYFNDKLLDCLDNIKNICEAHKDLSDKEVGELIGKGKINSQKHNSNNKNNNKYVALNFIFLVRKKNLYVEYINNGKIRDSIFNLFRPDSNNVDIKQ